MYKYTILYNEPNKSVGVFESTYGVVQANDFEAAMKRVLKYYNNYIITSISLVAIDDIIDVMDMKEI